MGSGVRFRIAELLFFFSWLSVQFLVEIQTGADNCILALI